MSENYVRVSWKEFDDNKLLHDKIINSIKMEVGSLPDGDVDYEWRVKHEDNEGCDILVW